MPPPDSSEQRVRLADDERDTLAEALGRHYVAGRLDADALNARVEAVYGAEFRDEAQAALADLLALEPAARAAAPARRGGLRRRGPGEAEAAQPGWRPTPERFLDPSTDRIMRVWIDPADGRRHYVAEGG